MTNLNALFNCLKPDNSSMQLAAIWLEKPIVIGSGKRTARITNGDELTIWNGGIIDSLEGTVTHRVIGCYGTINGSSLEFELKSIKTGEISILKIK